MRPEFDGEKFIETYDIWDRQVSQEDAAYSPAGGLSGKPCATCRWYVSPDACVIVSDWPEPINSIGTSNRYEAKEVFESEPLEVIIVGEAELTEETVEPDPERALAPAHVEMGLIDLRIPQRIKEAVVNFARKLMAGAEEPEAEMIGNNDGVLLFKEKDGSLRWFIWASNKWRDSDHPPEIFEEKAHKEFVDYLDGGGKMPEAWLWHTPGARWGVADWVDYSDGFLMYSGPVDPGMEDVAIKIANDENSGVSHGFTYLYSDEQNGIIGWYRDHEVSVLPMEWAANKWTGIDIITKEATAMGFTDAKRDYLVGKLGATKVEALEGDTEGLKDALEAAGIAWKDVPDADADTDDKDGGANVAEVDYDKIAASAVKAIEDSPGMKAIGTRMDDFESKLGEMAESIKGLEATEDQKIAAKFSAKAKPGAGHQASAHDDNVLTDDDKKAKAILEAQGPVSPFAQSIVGAPQA